MLHYQVLVLILTCLCMSPSSCSSSSDNEMETATGGIIDVATDSDDVKAMARFGAEYIAKNTSSDMPYNVFNISKATLQIIEETVLSKLFTIRAVVGPNGCKFSDPPETKCPPSVGLPEDECDMAFFQRVEKTPKLVSFKCKAYSRDWPNFKTDYYITNGISNVKVDNFTKSLAALGTNLVVLRRFLRNKYYINEIFEPSRQKLNNGFVYNITVSVSQTDCKLYEPPSKNCPPLIGAPTYVWEMAIYDTKDSKKSLVSYICGPPRFLGPARRNITILDHPANASKEANLFLYRRTDWPG